MYLIESIQRTVAESERKSNNIFSVVPPIHSRKKANNQTNKIKKRKKEHKHKSTQRNKVSLTNFNKWRQVTNKQSKEREKKTDFFCFISCYYTFCVLIEAISVLELKNCLLFRVGRVIRIFFHSVIPNCVRKTKFRN